MTDIRLALENERLRRKLKRLQQVTVTDELTGVLNRRGIERAIEQAARRAARNSKPVSVVFMDLDHFKQVNDLHGHAAGDRVLQLVGCALRAFTRGHEAAGRWGGEEFAIVTDNDRAGAVQFAERLRQTVARSVYVDVDGVPDYVTASFGVAEIGPAWRESIEEADRALYAAKANGRNCTRTV